MSTNEKTADVAATTTTAMNNDQAVRTTDLTLRPATPGFWALSANGRPALMFNHHLHAAQTMHDIHEDLLDGFAHWAGEFDHITAEYLDFAADGSMRGDQRKAGADYRVCKGWS